MSASAALAGKPNVRLRGRSYPVVLPTWRDPRLHLAATIISLQVLGQVAFEFRLSIAQILVALGTCAVLEVGIAFFRHHVILWPASALLTGNGVAFVLRVPGTEHGDWWSMHGWWIFAGTAAVALLSKYLIRFRGRHIFNPSNFGLVLCFLLIGPERADPLEFWWGPMSAWMALALAIIVVGGLTILSRLRLLEIAVGFWLAFAAGPRGARRERPRDDGALAPRAGRGLGALADPRLLARDPRLPLLHDHRPEDDPVRAARTARVRASGSACSRCSCSRRRRPSSARRSRCSRRSRSRARRGRWPRCSRRACAGRRCRRSGAAAGRGSPRSPWPRSRAWSSWRGSRRGRPRRASAARLAAAELPEVTVARSEGVSTQLDHETALAIAGDLVADLRAESQALADGDHDLATEGAAGARLAAVWKRIDASGATAVPDYTVERVRLTLEPGDGQSAPLVVARRARHRRARHVRGLAAGSRRAQRSGAVRADARARAPGRPLPDRRLARRRRRARPAGRRAGARGGRGARRRPAGGRRAARGTRLPPRRLPVRDVQRPGGDDGRRALLARLRRRRLARPLRRQLVLDRDRRRALEGARRPARAARSTGTSAASSST